MESARPNRPREISLSTTPDAAALQQLRLGDIVYLDGLIYTAREGYMRALEQGGNIPMELPAQSAANFTAPAATIHPDGSFSLGAVTATASFRLQNLRLNGLPVLVQPSLAKAACRPKIIKIILSRRRYLSVYCRVWYRRIIRSCRGG